MIKVGVIGLGRIGFGYDSDMPDVSLTHFKALMQDPRFEISWVCDSSQEHCQVVKNQGFPEDRVFLSIPDQPVDLVVIATPTITHLQMVRDCVALRPKAILCEKPAGENLAQIMAIQNLAELNKINVFVNYMRRCEPGVNDIKRKIEGGSFGHFYKGVCWYSGGLENNGSHFIDLLRFWFGEIEKIFTVDQVAVDCERVDYGKMDVDFIAQFACGLRMYFIAGDEQSFGSKEIELLSDRGVLKYLRGGFDIAFYPARLHERFAGYNAYGLSGQTLANDYVNFMRYVYEELYLYFANGKAFPASLNNAIAVHKTIAQILRGNSD